MKIKRALAMLLTVIVCVFLVPTSVYSASTTLTLTLSASVPDGEQPKLGDNITYTVALSNNGGLSGGTLFFLPSDNLEYQSATLKGEATTAIKSNGEGNEGAYGIRFMGDISTDNSDAFCSITFMVVGDGTAELELYAFELVNGTVSVEPTIVGGNQSHTVAELQKPVVLTSSLPEAVKGYSYSAKLESDLYDFITWTVSDGSLPSGLTLSEDGTVSGTPTEYGDFSFAVTVTLLGKLESDPKTVSISILQKPRKLELTSESTYEITDEDYLTGIKARTKVSDVIAHFKNNEYVKVFDTKGNEASSSAYIGTGYTVSLMHENEKVHTVTVVVKGDTDGDGRITSIDYMYVRLHYMRKSPLENAYLNAAHIDNDGRITSIDYMYIRLHYMSEIDIYEIDIYS